MKKFVLMIMMTISCLVQAQTSVFETGDYLIKLTTTQRSNADSLDIEIHFTNKSIQSIYFNSYPPVICNWSVSGKLLFIDFGMDIKSFTESEFDLVSVRTQETWSYRVAMSNHGDVTQVRLSVSLGRSSQVLADNRMKNHYLEKKGLTWVGGLFYIPICR